MFRSNNIKVKATIIILVVIVLDLITKWIISNNLYPYQSIPVINNFFNIVYAKNYGAAFSFLNGAPDWFRKPFFFVIPLVAMVFVGYIMFRAQKDKMQFFAFAAVLGGALGNFISRVYSGYVVDFLDFKLTNTYHWPSFNVADIAITVGLVLVMLDLTKMESKKKKSRKK
jgi:signal peptidase II